jgi:hypothetical protein
MTVIRGIEKDVKTDIKAAMRMQVRGWKAVVCVFAGGAILVLPLGAIGRLDLAYPIMDSVIALGLTVFIKWQLRQHTWFWITVSVFAAVHLAVILSVHWTDKWVWSRSNAGIATLDFIVMLLIVDVIARLMRRGNPRRTRRLDEGA